MNTPIATTLRLGPADRGTLLDHFTALGSADRRLRFGAYVSNTVLEEYVERLDFAHDGLFAVQDDHLSLIAVVHIACAAEPCELGLSVSDGHRGQGYGSLLMNRALVFLRNRGTRTVFVHCLAENAAMMHLARKNRMRLTHAGSESDGHLELQPATAESYISEWLQDQNGRAVRTMRMQARLARIALDPWPQ
jgi:GNAT superfamily N-acetyltransferase